MRYIVTRDCCLSGQCFNCRGMPKKARVIQQDTTSQMIAEQTVTNWKAWHPTLEQRPDEQPEGS